MKVTTNKTQKGVLLYVQYEPQTPTDTFMQCVSFWAYGTVKERRLLRRKLMLYHAKHQFGREFRSLKQFVRLYMQNDLENIPDAFEFIMTNRRCGVVSDLDVMTRLVADFFSASVYVDGKLRAEAVDRVSLMFLCTKRQQFRLKMSDALDKVHTTPKFRLCAACNDDWTDLGVMERRNAISWAELAPETDKQLFTIVPAASCLHTSTVFVYVCQQDTCTQVAMSNDFNPYFFTTSTDPLKIVVVEHATKEGAAKLLEQQNRVKVI